MESAVVCIARLENPYVQEFVSHYLGLGFSKIVICDNGFGDEPGPEGVLAEETKSGCVEILDCRDKKLAQSNAYTECYKAYGNQFDWLAFFDCDEFLILPQDKSVGEFLNRFPKDAQLVSVNWQLMTDNEQVRPDGRTLAERFTTPMAADRKIQYDFPENRHTKSIVRGGLSNIRFCNPHTPVTRLKSYHASLMAENQGYYHDVDYTYAILRHYVTKTIWEWVGQKIRRGRCDCTLKHTVDEFFKYNLRTSEKEAAAKEAMAQWQL